MTIYLIIAAISTILLYGMLFADIYYDEEITVYNFSNKFVNKCRHEQRKLQGMAMLIAISVGFLIIPTIIKFFMSGFAYNGLKFTLGKKESK